MKKKTILVVWLMILLVPAIIIDSQVPTGSHALNGFGASAQIAMAAPSEATLVTLPFVSNSYPLNTVFGIQMESSTPTKGLTEVIGAKTSWIRQHALLWSEVESIPGERNWAAAADLEQALLDSTRAGIQTILIVHGTPTWAQTIDGATCGPIRDDALDEFGQFLSDAVLRYSKPPFNVEYWEIWNEPDVEYHIDTATAPFGCWGDDTDKYYGGGYYAQVLKLVYPVIKAANPNVKVLIGGLLLDCDPRGVDSYCDKLNHLDEPPKYLEGILLNGGGPYFDGVSFHAYDYFPYYAPVFGQYSNDNWGAAWNTTGPVSSLKVQFIREVLSKYGVADKFIMNTEAALICGNNPTTVGCESDATSPYELTKATYVAQAYGSAIKDQLRANVWYSIMGWRNSGLLYNDLTPHPAFTAYTAARAVLKDAGFQQEVTSYPGVRGLEYQRNQRTIWLLWSLDGSSHLVTLPSLPTHVYNHLGEQLTPALEIDVTLNPIYVDWYR